MNQKKPKFQAVPTIIEKGFIEEITEKVKQLVNNFKQIPQNVLDLLGLEFEQCQQELSEHENADLEQYFDQKLNSSCPNIWKVRLRATGNYEGKEFIGWLVFPANYPESWPVFCFCYPKHNNLDKVYDAQRLAFQHENIYQSGELCIPALGEEAWIVQGQRNLKDICQKIGHILGHPNNASPANQKLVENSDESKKLLIQNQLQLLNDYEHQR